MLPLVEVNLPVDINMSDNSDPDCVLKHDVSCLSTQSGSSGSWRNPKGSIAVNQNAPPPWRPTTINHIAGSARSEMTAGLGDVRTQDPD